MIDTAAAVSVVIPVVDEAEALVGLLADLDAQRGVDLQVIVADGGSRDNSVAAALARGAEVVAGERGRGTQMNAGAACARHEWLCFIHADSRLTHPDQLAGAIRRLDACGPLVAGHFALRFVRSRAKHGFFYRFLEAKSATGRRYTINGDQGLILSRAFFDALGGFDTCLSFLEDQRMAAAIESTGRWCLLDHRLATSARRFEREGAARRYLLMALIMAMHIVDVDAFFERAPQIYARQAETERLLISPYFRLLRRLVRDCGPRASLRVAWRIAGLALTQTWQLFFVLDVALAPVLGSRLSLARVHDRYLFRIVVNRAVQSLWFVVLLAIVFGPLQLWFLCCEYRRVAQ